MDLQQIVMDMCATEYALPRWVLADALHCCRLYKNFLILIKKHWPEPLVPTRQIDEFWHNHILYTKKYFQDCQHIFGHYLHHQPASPHEDKEQLVKKYLKTKAYYLAEFHEPLELIVSA